MSQPPPPSGGPAAPGPYGLPGDRSAPAPHQQPAQPAGAAVPPPPPPHPAPGGGPAYPPPPGSVPGQQQYGHPQQPPAQPAYGHPQQPPAQPGPNPYAQQPPGGYGYPQPNPYMQPGHPQQPYPPAVPPAPARRGLAGGRLAALVAGVAAAVLVVGGGVWLLASGGGGKHRTTAGGSGGASGGPHNANGRVAWTVAAPADLPGRIISPTAGQWFSGGNVVKQTPTGVTAYDLATGKQQWQVAAPENYTCTVSSAQVDNKIALQYGAHCGNVMVVDTAAGRMLWHQALPPLAGVSPTTQFDNTDMAISGGTLAVTWGLKSVAYDVGTGKAVWGSKDGGDCFAKGFAGGAKLVEVYSCGLGVNTPFHVAVVDPASGKPTWTWDAPAGTSVGAVLSVDPVVVGLTAGGNSGLTDVWNIDGGRLRSHISLGRGGGNTGEYAVSCPVVQMTPCTNAVVDGNTLYTVTTAHAGSQRGSSANEIAAFDLSSGSGRLLTKSLDNVVLVAADGTSLVAYDPPAAGSDHGGRILKVDKTSGAVSTWTTFSDATRQQEQDATGPSVSSLDFGWHNDTLVLSLKQKTSGVSWKYLLAALH